MNCEALDGHDSVKLPAVGPDKVARTLEVYWGLVGELTALNGERDLNFLFRVVASGQRFVFKVCNAAEDPSMLDCQAEVFRRLGSLQDYRFTQVINTVAGEASTQIIGDDDVSYHCRLVEWVDGRLYADCYPRSGFLHRSLGRCLAQVDRSLVGFSHEALERPLSWDLCRAQEVLARYDGPGMTPEQRDLVTGFQELYRDRVEPVVGQLRRGVIHNDANDNNVLVGVGPNSHYQVTGLIDFGDLLVGWLASEVAIAATYAMMEAEHPLDVAADILAGYQEILPLREVEIGVIFPLICMRLCLSVSIATEQQRQEPDNKYLGISVKPSWELMRKLAAIPPDYAYYLLRARCGLVPVPVANRVEQWLRSQTGFTSIVDTTLDAEGCLVLDASVTSPYVDFGWEPHDAAKMTREIFQAMESAGVTVGLGRYAEYRLIYDSDDFIDFTGHRRTLHLGIDIFQAAGSPVFAPLAGQIHSHMNNPARFDYGGSVVLSHQTDVGDQFYTLYGHLDPETLKHLNVGEVIEPGDLIGRMGAPEVNGDWPPHVHFEIITDLLGWEGTFVGVGSHSHRDVWCAICPDPNLVLCLDGSPCGADIVPVSALPVEDATVGEIIGAPGFPVRSAAQYVYDETGRRYLDGRGGGSWFGHSHPDINSAAVNQAKLSSESVSQEHPLVRSLVTRLRELAPANMGKVYLTGSFSEARQFAALLMGQDGYMSQKSLEATDVFADKTMQFLIGSYGMNQQNDSALHKPGIVILGDALANGFPLGAVMYDDSFSLAAQFAGFSSTISPIALAAAHRVLDLVEKNDFQQQAANLGQELAAQLAASDIQRSGNINVRVDGMSCVLGFNTDLPVDYVAGRLAERGILVNTVAAYQQLVFTPPLTVKREDIARFVTELDEVFARDTLWMDLPGKI